MVEAVATAPKTARMRQVETKIIEQQPISEGESTGLGMLPLEWLRDQTPEQLADVRVRIYRREPLAMAGFLEALGGGGDELPCIPIDEAWIAARYGGGVYGVKVYSKKDGKGGFDPAVRIAGLPKLSPRERTEPATPTPAASNGDNGIGRLVDVLERTIDRLDRQHPPAATAAPPQGAREIIETMSALEDLRKKVNPEPPAPKSALEDLGAILQIVDKLKPPPPVESPLQKALLDAVIAQVTIPKKSLIDELEGLGKLLPLIQNFAGGGGGTDWKQLLIEKGLDRVPEIIDGVGKVMDKRVNEAQALAAREQARARLVEVARGVAPASPIPTGPAPVQTSAKPAEPAEPAPWRPLSVVPIDGQSPAQASPAEVIPPGVAITDEQARAAAAIDAYLKNRVVQLVAQHAEAGLVVDFIDSASPELGAMLSQATESQIREFIGADPVLAEIKGLPHYESFLREFLEVLHEESEPARVQ
jgi:hypothetical protein